MANNNTFLNTIASAMIVNGINQAKSTCTKKTQAEVKKTDAFKEARKQARVDSMIWATQIKAVKDANPGAADEDIENAVLSMGYNKPETENETIERLQAVFLNDDQQAKVAEYADQIAGMSDTLDSVANYNDAAIQTPTPSYTTRTYYTAREQYESHRDITLRNSSAKRGASAAERLDCNLNAFSEHLEIFARKFKR